LDTAQIIESSSITTVHYVFLHDRYIVIREFLECITCQIGDPREFVVEDHEYTARFLCGRPFWSLLTPYEKRLAGSCISHLARSGLLPLVQVNKPGHYPNRYVLTTSLS